MLNSRGMYGKKASISYALYFIFVIFTIYQDSPFSLFLGAAGYALVMPLTLIMFILIVVLNNFKVCKFEEINTFWMLMLWVVFSSVLGIVLWVVFGNPITVVNEFLPYKAFKTWVQLLTYPMYIYIMLFCLNRINDVQQIFAPLFVALIIMTVVCVFESFQLPNAFESIHFAGIFPYYRIRLLTMESSSTSIQIYIYGGMLLYYSIAYERRFVFFVTAACCVYLIAETTSKALLIAVIIAVLAYFCIRIKKISLKILRRLLLVIALSVVIGYTMLPKLIYLLQSDITYYTSVISRSFTSILGLGIGIVFPFGVGCGAYLGFFQKALKKFVPYIRRFRIPFNLIELEGLANQNTDLALTVKSGLFQLNLYWGILGSVIFVRMIYRVYKKLKRENLPCNELLQAIFFAATFLSLFEHINFEYWLLLAIVIRLNKMAAVLNCNEGST